jgi:hypothetical protein
MMPSVEALLILGGTAILCLLILAGGLAWGWACWLRLRARELELGRPEKSVGPETSGQRIDIADLKARIRKLEAIASGVNF